MIEALIIATLSQAVRSTTPVLFAALGENFGEISGTMNLGIEGVMLAAAFAGFVAGFFSGSLLFGLLAGVIVGLILGLVISFLCISLRINQIVIGLGLFLAMMGLTSYLMRTTFGTTLPRTQFVQEFPIPLLSSIPFLGPILFSHSVLVYTSFLLVPVFWYVLYRTKFGLNMRAVGESPFAVDVAGVSVTKTRYYALIIACVMAGLGGAYLTLGVLSFFYDEVTQGRGWIAMAITMFGEWKPHKVLAGALIYGGVESLAFTLQAVGLIQIPAEIFLALPYVLTLLALVLVARHSRWPAAFAIPYKRGSR